MVCHVFVFQIVRAWCYIEGISLLVHCTKLLLYSHVIAEAELGRQLNDEFDIFFYIYTNNASLDLTVYFLIQMPETLVLY